MVVEALIRNPIAVELVSSLTMVSLRFGVAKGHLRGGKTAFFWAGFNVICVVWIFFRLPEPSGLTYAELDKLFADGVSARRFQSAVKEINVFQAEEEKVAQTGTKI